MELPQVHAAQRRFLEEAKRFNVVCAGAGASAKRAGHGRVIHTAMQAKPAAWFSPSYELPSTESVYL
jgi:hypothetical protein